MKKSTFYILSWTWGLPLTLIGGIVTLALMCAGNKPKRFGNAIYTEIGEGWGGFEMGAFFICSKTAKIHTKIHELGHGCQNCIYGPLIIPLVTIPSAIRYWYRRFRVKLGFSNTDYDSIWFEKQATRLGALAYIKK